MKECRMALMLRQVFHMLLNLLLAFAGFLFFQNNIFFPNLASSESSGKIKWQKIAEGIEFAAYNPEIDALFSQEIVFIRSSLSKVVPAVLFDKNFKFSTAKEFCTNSNSLLCINANFFDEEKKPLGLVVRNGTAYNPLHKGGSLLNGIFTYNNGTAKIIPRDAFNESKTPQLAIQSGPLLLQNGKVYSRFKSGDNESRRSGACIDSQNRLVIFCSSGGVTGPSLNNLVSILLMPAINCKDAINFDGGGSSQLYLNDQAVNIRKHRPNGELSIGKDSVPVALSLVTK